MQYIIGRHNVTDDGIPAGGITSGVGIHIEWQNGALRTKGTDEPAAPNGAFVEGVIEAAIDRVEHYQSTRFACAENDEILLWLRSALNACHIRTANRAEQGVEGTHELHTTPATPSSVPDHQAIAESVLGPTTALPGDDVVPPGAKFDTPQLDPPLEPDHADL